MSTNASDALAAPASGGATATARQRRREWIAFLMLAVFIWPVIAVGVVASYGLFWWMYYTFFGPPGPGPGGH